jgi:hypothetical protein
MEFSRDQPNAVATEELTLYAGGNEWSEEYKILTQEFYLKI